MRFYRDIDSIPVLAAEGTILPMYRDGRSNNLSLDQPLDIHVWRGNGSYELYEDDGETNAYKEGKYAITSFKLEEKGDNIRLTITPPTDSNGLLPTEREMYIKFRDVDTEEIKVKVADEPVVIELNNIRPLENEDKNELKSAILTRVQGSNDKKSLTFKKRLPRFVREVLAEFDAFYTPEK